MASPAPLVVKSGRLGWYQLVCCFFNSVYLHNHPFNSPLSESSSCGKCNANLQCQCSAFGGGSPEWACFFTDACFFPSCGGETVCPPTLPEVGSACLGAASCPPYIRSGVTDAVPDGICDIEETATCFFAQWKVETTGIQCVSANPPSIPLTNQTIAVKV